MSTHDTDDTERQPGRELRESVDRAQTAINRLDHVSKQLARKGQPPEQSDRYFSALLDVDMAVMDAYNRLRKFLKLDATEYWCRYVVGYDDGAAVVLGGQDGDPVNPDELEGAGMLQVPDDLRQSQIRFLEAYEGAVKRRRVVTRERFGDMEEEVEYVPNILQPDDYRRALRVLDEARRDLGFTPTPTESTARTEITEEMIEKVGDWREENLPEEYLNGNQSN